MRIIYGKQTVFIGIKINDKQKSYLDHIQHLMHLDHGSHEEEKIEKGSTSSCRYYFMWNIKKNEMIIAGA